MDDAFRVSSKAVEQQGQIFEGHTYCVLESEFVHHSSGSGSGGGAGVVRKFTRDDVSMVLYISVFLLHAVFSPTGRLCESADPSECLTYICVPHPIGEMLSMLFCAVDPRDQEPGRDSSGQRYHA